MVELLLKKKAQVNCRLNAVRHASVTPLHIACGCLAPSAVDIVRLLLKYGAEVNAESLPISKEYLSLADPLVIEKNKIVNRIFISLKIHLFFKINLDRVSTTWPYSFTYSMYSRTHS
jgi:ankyrin repeat protein